MGRWWLGVVGLVVLGAAIAAAVWRLPVARRGGPPDVVLIVVDTLRADHLGVYGYDADTSPRIDAFARENLRFTFAVASAPWTAPSVASIFTGVYPTAHGVWRHADARGIARGQVVAAALGDGFQTLAEALGGAGYRTACVTANPWVDERLGFAQGFDVFETASQVPAEEVNERALGFLDDVQKDGNPERPAFFLYLHYMDPHTPYHERPGGPALGPATRARYPPSELPLLAQYDAEIAYLDQEIGELFDALRERGLYEDAVIVFTSDHGEEFMERGRRGHGNHVFNPEVHVPLILKAQGRRGEVENAVGLVDLYPTLLALAGAPADAQPQGVSLLDTEALSGRGVFSEMTRPVNHKAFTRSDGKKLILSYRASRGAVVARESGVVGLFDSRRDAREEEPLDDADLLSDMKEGFYALYSDSVRRSHGRKVPSALLTEETTRELRALGYLDDAPDGGAP